MCFAIACWPAISPSCWCAKTTVAGYAILSIAAGEAHILNLCIAPECRALGYGERLLDEMLFRARSASVRESFPGGTAVEPDGTWSVQEKRTFTKIAERPKYYQSNDGREDAAVLAKKLANDRLRALPDHGRSRKQVSKRRTFAIISHPDAGKTTLTEKLLLYGGAIQLAGTVKGRKASRHATSDWMALEQQRGISVTSSVMQFPYDGSSSSTCSIRPGHEDFSEDTYRTLTAVDSALMVIDCAKGVEQRTIKLMEVCRSARYADHDVHQQARSRGSRAHRSVGRD